MSLKLNRVLITTTDAENIPFKLTFFNNFESGPTGKGTYILNAQLLSCEICSHICALIALSERIPQNFIMFAYSSI